MDACLRWAVVDDLAWRIAAGRSATKGSRIEGLIRARVAAIVIDGVDAAGRGGPVCVALFVSCDPRASIGTLHGGLRAIATVATSGQGLLLVFLGLEQKGHRRSVEMGCCERSCASMAEGIGRGAAAGVGQLSRERWSGGVATRRSRHKARDPGRDRDVGYGWGWGCSSDRQQGQARRWVQHERSGGTGCRCVVKAGEGWEWVHIGCTRYSAP